MAREPGLISGGSTLQQWQLSVLRNGPDATAPRTLRVVPVAPVAVPDDGYLLTPTGTGVRYVVRESDKAGIRRVEVRQYNLRNNEDVVLGRFEGTFKATQFAPDAKRVAAVTDAGAVELYDAADGRRLWAADPAAKAREIRVVNEGRGGKGGFPFAGFTIPGVGSGTYPAVPAFVAFAGRAPRLLAVRGWVAPVVLDADTGKALPALEGVELAATSSRVAAVSGDGRLAVLAYHPLEPVEARGPGGGPPAGIPLGGPPVYTISPARLTAWDTTTGKVVRTWAGTAAALAFHPTRPVLAVLEANGTETRLGFWEFPAE